MLFFFFFRFLMILRACSNSVLVQVVEAFLDVALDPDVLVGLKNGKIFEYWPHNRKAYQNSPQSVSIGSIYRRIRSFGLNSYGLQLRITLDHIQFLSLITILEHVVIQYLRKLNKQIFQQDNAQPHVAMVTRQYLEQANLAVLLWPAFSPDLFPIEHISDEMTSHSFKRPEIKYHKPT